MVNQSFTPPPPPQQYKLCELQQLPVSPGLNKIQLLQTNISPNTADMLLSRVVALFHTRWRCLLTLRRSSALQREAACPWTLTSLSSTVTMATVMSQSRSRKVGDATPVVVAWFSCVSCLCCFCCFSCCSCFCLHIANLHFSYTCGM